MDRFIAIIHEQGDQVSVDLIDITAGLKSVNWERAVVSAMHHLDEKLFFGSALALHGVFSGDITAYARSYLGGRQILSVRRFLETFGNAVLIHGEGNARSVEIFETDSANLWIEKLVAAAHHLEEKVFWYSNTVLQHDFSGDMLAYAEHQFRSNECVTVKTLQGRLRR